MSDETASIEVSSGPADVAPVVTTDDAPAPLIAGYVTPPAPVAPMAPPGFKLVAIEPPVSVRAKSFGSRIWQALKGAFLSTDAVTAEKNFAVLVVTRFALSLGASAALVDAIVQIVQKA